jgi:L-fuculose-phosphate aldolase
MCEIGRRMYERGLVSAFEGNLSARVAPDRLLCTPSLLCKAFLKPEDLCVVDLTGKQLSGERKRSSEIFLHLGIYRERPEAEAVVHTHAPHATAFSVTHTQIPNCITGEVEVFLGEVPLAPYATPGSEQMGEVVAQLLRDARAPAVAADNSATGVAGASRTQQTIPQSRPVSARPPFAMLLANHGVVSWGQSLEQALHRSEILESYCRILVLARAVGPLERLGDHAMRDLMALKQKLGLPDRRAGQTTFEDCDLCGNNLFGRGFCNDRGGAKANDPAPDVPAQNGQKALGQATHGDMAAMVREITDRVWSAIHA